MSRSRDIAAIMGATEAVNTNNTALLDSASLPVTTAGSSITFIDSDNLLPDESLDNDSGDIIFSRSSNKMFVSEGSYWRSLTTSTINPLAEVLIVGGGGGGGPGPGGGAGGLLYYGSETPKTPNGSAQEFIKGSTYTITVGEGGTAKAGDSDGAGNDAPLSTAGERGFNSSIVGNGLNLVATGGGGGGAGIASNTGYEGGAGGSGGGGGANAATGGGAIDGGAGTSGQGNDGGAGQRVANSPAGGGGGAGAAAADVSSSPTAGGVGLEYDITGTGTYYAGGGGGGSYNAGGAAGGTGGGGNGANSLNQTATAGTDGTGGGGGGGGTAATGHGGDGIVVIRVTDNHSATTLTGGRLSTSVSGYNIYLFDSAGASGTIAFG